MNTYRRFSTLHQLAAGVCAFTAVIVVLDSGGIYRWAERLDVGPERSIALPVATALHHRLARLGLEREREDALVELARLRWSDDPEALAAARGVIPRGVTSSTADSGTAKTSEKEIDSSLPAADDDPPIVPVRPTPLHPLTGAPPLFTPLPEIDGVAIGKIRTVALAGDSMMAVGLSATILREAPHYKDLDFYRAFKSGTGLARPEVFDWQREYPAMLSSGGVNMAKPDFILVAIGANDGQGFVEGGITYPFGTPGWQAIYQRRVEAYLDMLTADGATVVWLGLPPMKSTDYDQRIALINRIDATVVKSSPHAIWFSTAGLVGDSDGRFRDFGEVDGKTTRLRQGDGIHLSDDGAVLVVEKLLPWLAAQEPAPTPVASTSVSPVTTSTSSANRLAAVSDARK